MRFIPLSIAVLMATGCMAPNQQAPQISPEMNAAQLHAMRNPNSRFQVAGKREYSNGTEIYVLDSQSGQVCYYFIASGSNRSETGQKEDLRACAGEALAPTLQ